MSKGKVCICAHEVVLGVPFINMIKGVLCDHVTIEAICDTTILEKIV